MQTGPKTERLTILRADTHKTELGDHDFCHIILTPTQPVGSGRPQRESNPGPPHQESRAQPTELPRPQRYGYMNVDAVLRLLGVFHDVLYGDEVRAQH